MNQVRQSGVPEYLRIVHDQTALYRAGAEIFISAAKSSIAKNGRFSVALSGGNTPRGVHETLEQRRDVVPWDKVFVFFGDERTVPPDHPDSNYRMAKESLLSRVPIPARNIFRIPAELPPELAAQEYEETLRRFFQLPVGLFPRFDLIFLGMGNDGHTASLFPGTSALGEQSRLVVANCVEKMNTWRITLTLPVLNNAAEVVFLVSGVTKAPVLAKILSAKSGDAFPAQSVKPTNGQLLWLVDEDAARLI